jgi:hypothetical protein
MVFTFVSAKSLWFRLWPGAVRVLFGSTSSNVGVTPRYHAVGEVGETSKSDLLRRCAELGCRFESEVLRMGARGIP